MQNWFPLNRSMLENSEEFRRLTHTEKVFFINLVADMNAAIPDGGTFYRSDPWYAAALNISPRKVRQARVKFKKLDLIDYKSGGMARNRPLATTYTRVEWARPPKKGEGEFFAPMLRHELDMALDKLREGFFRPEDVVLFCYIVYWRHKHRDNETFFLSKSQFSRITGIKNVAGCIQSLYENFKYTGGSHLFEYNICYHKIVLWKLSHPGDPSEGKDNVEVAERYRQEIDEKAKCLSQEKKKDWGEWQRKRKTKPETVPGEQDTKRKRRRMKRRKFA